MVSAIEPKGTGLGVIIKRIKAAKHTAGHFAKFGVASTKYTVKDDKRLDDIRTEIEAMILEHDAHPDEKMQDLDRMLLEWRHDEETLRQHVETHYQNTNDVQV